MKEFIEKLIGRLEEIPTKTKCSECPHKQKCDEIEAMDKEEQIDLCGATIKALAIDTVKEIAEEYKNTNIITDFLQYARDNANNYDTNEGWSLADLIDLSIKYSEEYINTSTDTSTTNADRIRSMTDEELAEFLDDLTDNCCRCAEHQNCGNCQIGLDAKTGFCDIKKWLQSEVEGVTENE